MREEDAARISLVLEEFHASASASDEARHLATLSDGAVFLGTDAAERWAGAEYRSLIHRYFSQGKGWTYVSSARSVTIADDGRTAWFDELLESEWYGTCRGSGVLRLRNGEWKIEQYNLSIPVPNAIAKSIVSEIRKTRG